MENERESFVVDNDQKAEWAIRKVKEIRAERDRLNKVCEEQIAFYRDQISKNDELALFDETYFVGQLAAYFATVNHTVTKTLEKYALPSGSLVLRQKPPTWTRGEGFLNEVLNLEVDDSEIAQFVKTETTIKWSDFKDRLSIVDGTVNYITNDGELIPIETVKCEPTDPVFEVKA